MSRIASLNLVLAVLVAAVFGLGLAWTPDRSQRNVEFLPQMVAAVPAESFAASEVLPGGAVQLTPPAGTIARGFLPLGLGAGEEDAVRAGFELTSPLGDHPNVAGLGAEVFRTYCALCHGHQGLGDGVVAQRGFPAPPSLLAENARSLPDGRIFHIVTFGQGNMPGHAAQIGRAERWAAVAHVRALQAATPPQVPLPLEGGEDQSSSVAEDSATEEGA